MISLRRVCGAGGLATLVAIAVTVASTRGVSSPSPGALDPSFGKRGKVTTRIGRPPGFVRAESVAIGPRRGRIVAAGEQPFIVARYRRDGRLDDSFAKDGIVKTRFGTKHSGAHGVAITGHGEVVAVGGSTSLQRHRRAQRRFAIALYKPNGDLDRSFSHDGKLQLNLGQGTKTEAASAVVLDSKGRIVVGGLAPKHDDEHGVIVRLGKNGRLDHSFGSRGVLDTGPRIVSSLAIDSRGRIVVGAGGEVQRYAPNGALDHSFGSGGTVPVSSYTPSVAIDSGERIVVTGPTRSRNFLVDRYTPTGRPDMSFGNDGTTMTRFAGRSGAYSVAIDSKTRVVAFGYVMKNGFCCQFATARYQPDGDPDPSFGNNGKVRTKFGGRRVEVNPSAVATDARDRILGAGGAKHGFAFVRYIG
jgi:uncharacterized delta-60 repeat protein